MSNRIKTLLPLLLFLGCAQKEEMGDQLIGRWDMVDVSIGSDNVTSDLDPTSDRWLKLNLDGSFQSGGGLESNGGTYTYEDKVLSLDSDAGEGDDSQWTLEIKGDTLIMRGVGTERQEESKIVNVRASGDIPSLSIDTYPVQGQYRALEVVDENTIWYAGAQGRFGYSEDGGSTWYQDSIVFEGNTPHFRSLAVTDDAVFILSIASPALLFKSTDKGRSWDLVHRDNSETIFYDALEFWNDSEGIAVGDEMDGCIAVLITRDGGTTWQKSQCEDLPVAMEGEGFFAASDTNISIVGDETWVGSTKSRVYYSPDKGLTWSLQETPIAKGKTMTGIFSVAMLDAQNGIVFGGDWEIKDQMTENKAMTSDGGKTWNLVSDGNAPGYRSCVKYFPGSNGTKLLAVGIPGISFSGDGGQTWSDLSDRNVYTLRFTPTGKTGWIAGADLLGKIEFVY